MSRLTRDGAAEPVSRDQVLRRERGQGNSIFPCSADHEQDWQPYPVDTYSCNICDKIQFAKHLFWCICMTTDKISVQYKNGFLPDIIRSTLCGIMLMPTSVGVGKRCAY